MPPSWTISLCHQPPLPHQNHHRQSTYGEDVKRSCWKVSETERKLGNWDHMIEERRGLREWGNEEKIASERRNGEGIDGNGEGIVGCLWQGRREPGCGWCGVIIDLFALIEDVIFALNTVVDCNVPHVDVKCRSYFFFKDGELMYIVNLDQC